MIYPHDVGVFMAAGDQKASPEVARLYLALMVEEVGETLVAEGFADYGRLLEHIAENIKTGASQPDMRLVNDVECFDGGLDAIWVTIGYMIAKEFPISEGWRELTGSNMSKMVDGRLLKDAHGKVIKGKDYYRPRLDAVLNGEDDAIGAEAE
jgi:hypothetical protein